MSTEPQLLGDSRRRQLEASRAYAAANGLELAEGAEFKDIGVSAFKGANVRDGALGQFLQAVRSGAIRPGSTLIVESLDRLSREQVLIAQSLFLSINQAGIHLVTLMDGKRYEAGKVDLADLITSLVIMSRAHEESLAKSHRIAAAWKNKRSEAAKKPMTKWCPAWLSLTTDRSHYEPISERVEIVRQIFEDTANGVGMYSIATRLNRANAPTFGGPNGWHQSYIAKILSNRAVLGDFQPHIRVEGKRVPDGESVLNYYPAIIEEELFYRAQLGKAQRRGKAGRKGLGFTNLFSGLAKCAYCQSPIKFENKGAGPKGGTYLICDGATRQKKCSSVRWRYADFEASFLAFVEELDIASIVNVDSQLEKRHSIERSLAALNGQLVTTVGLMEQTYAVLSQGGPVEFVTSKLKELEKRRAKLANDIGLKSDELEDLRSHRMNYQRSKDEIRQLVRRLQDADADGLFKTRAHIASQLKALIHQISIAPLGSKPNLSMSIERFRNREDTPRNRAMVAHFTRSLENPERSHPYFGVSFSNGTARVVFPHPDDPLSYRTQVIVSDERGFEILRQPSAPDAAKSQGS